MNTKSSQERYWCASLSQEVWVGGWVGDKKQTAEFKEKKSPYSLCLFSVLTGWECRNKFRVTNSMGQQVYYALEGKNEKKDTHTCN